MDSAEDALQVLVVDDDAGVREAMSDALAILGHQIAVAPDGASALTLAQERRFDVVITDVRLPRLDGIDLFRHLRRESPDTSVILMTGHPQLRDAVTVLREGASDYLKKPPSLDELARRLEDVAAARRLARSLGDAQTALDASAAAPILGRSPPMTRLLGRLDLMAQSQAPILITGESGTGKELIARAVHERSPRRGKQFVAVNCAAFPETLLEAELFGHERGAFTGAVKRREGRFQAAHGGTLLLDEVAEMPLPAQAKLLRVLQEHVVEPLGTDTPVAVDVRVLSATHRDLKLRILDGTFREDLYYRLKVLDLHAPPLRERTGDLPMLLRHFLGQSDASARPRAVPITPRAWAALERYPYPGNVRELAHIVERALVLAHGAPIDLDDLPDDVVGSSGPRATELRTLQVAMREYERAYLVQALHLVGGKRARAAELLGISRKSLWEKLRQYAITLEGGDQ